MQEFHSNDIRGINTSYNGGGFHDQRNIRERANELEKEISGLRNRLKTLEDVIRHEQELSEKGEDPGEIRYMSNRRIETPECIYPSGVVLAFKAIDVLELLKTEKVRLNQKLIELEEEFREL